MSQMIHILGNKKLSLNKNVWRDHATTLLRPYYTAKRTREILISNIHLLSPQKCSQFVHFNIEKAFPRGQP